MSNIATLPARSEVAAADTWDLSTLYADDDSWEADFTRFQGRIGGFEPFAGTLAASPERLAECLEFDESIDRLGEQLGVYAFLRTTEDQADSGSQGMMLRFQNAAAQAGQLASFIRPEVLAIPEDQMSSMLQHASLAPFKVALERMVRFKPHTLSLEEESLLSMQAEMASTAGQAFNQLHDADLKFGLVENEDGVQVELGNATFGQLLNSPKREVRKQAFHQYYEQFAAHENTLAALLGGSIKTNVYYANARRYDGSLVNALFPDNVPPAVYDRLIESVRTKLSAVHRYYDVRRRKMGLDDIHQYDTYVPILSELEVERSWEEAVELVLASLTPLGDEYCAVLRGGLTTARWSDRYPNQGKRSGAFSCGSFDAAPFILMNYKPTVLNDVYTLAHEAGHSMHSYYSAQSQAYTYYNYTIFVAEVASTFNEQLLSRHMLSQAEDDKTRAYLLNRQIDDIRGTIIRQTMFAEFEKATHEMAERGEALTVDAFKQVYDQLLKDYFGPDFVIDGELSLECFRIPHFYRAFYVYKYATGLSAAIALSQRVLGGGAEELGDYLSFLQGGCSKEPLDLLRDAGVDMESPEPVNTALDHFETLVDELDSLL
jgi:oligoendopeptidase F